MLFTHTHLTLHLLNEVHPEPPKSVAAGSSASPSMKAVLIRVWKL